MSDIAVDPQAVRRVALARRVAVALKLPEDYFPETRLEFVIQELTRQPVLLDRVYDQLRRSETRPRPRRAAPKSGA